MQQTDDMERLWRLVNDVKGKFDEIVKLSQKRVALAQSIRKEEQEESIKSTNIIENLRSDITNLYESKKEFAQKTNSAGGQSNVSGKSVDRFKTRLLTLIRNQKRYLDCIKKEISLFYGIMSNANQINDDLNSLIGEGGELKELITYFSIIVNRQSDNRKKQIGEKLLSRIMDFSKKLLELKALNDKFFKIKIDIQPNEIQIYQEQILDENVIRQSKDLNVLAEHILSVLTREKTLLEAIIVFDTIKSELENIVNDMYFFSHEVKEHQTHRIALNFGKKKTAATIVLALSELFSLAFGQDAPQNQPIAPESPPGIYAKYDSSNVNNQTSIEQLDLASSRKATLQQKYAFLDIDRRDPLEKNLLSKISIDLCNKYPKFKDMDLTVMIASALFNLKFYNDGTGLKVIDAIDDIGNAYGTNDRAEFNFEMGKFIIDDLRKPLVDIPHVNSATPLQPKQWMENGCFWLPAMWAGESVETILPKTKVTDASARSLAHFALAATLDGKYGQRAIEYFEQNKMTRDIGYISITLGDACKIGGHFESAYNMYYVSLEKTKRQDTYEKMAECARQFNDSLLLQTAYAFVDEFSPGSPDIKSFAEGTGQVTRGLKDAIKTGKYFVFDSQWRWKDGNVIPKRIDNPPVDKVNMQQINNYVNRVRKMAGIMSSNEKGGAFLVYACKKYWNNAAFVKECLPKISGRPYDATNEIYEKAIQEPRFQQDRPFFANITTLLSTYYVRQGRVSDTTRVFANFDKIYPK